MPVLTFTQPFCHFSKPIQYHFTGLFAPGGMYSSGYPSAWRLGGGLCKCGCRYESRLNKRRADALLNEGNGMFWMWGIRSGACVKVIVRGTQTLCGIHKWGRCKQLSNNAKPTHNEWNVVKRIRNISWPDQRKPWHLNKEGVYSNKETSKFKQKKRFYIDKETLIWTKKQWSLQESASIWTKNDLNQRKSMQGNTSI